MEIVDTETYKLFIDTEFNEEMFVLNNRVRTVFRTQQREFRDHHLLGYFTKFLKENQYLSPNIHRKSFLEVFKETFLHLSKWERHYDPRKKTDKALVKLEFSDPHTQFRHMVESFLNKFCGVYFQERKGDLDSNIPRFFNELSKLLIELIQSDFSQGRISFTLYQLLDGNHSIANLKQLQDLFLTDWYSLGQKIQQVPFLHPSPFLKQHFNGKTSPTKKPSYIQLADPRYLKERFFRKVIDQKRLIKASPELTVKVRSEELTEITKLIKELFAELREGDEVEVEEALSIIAENIQLEMHTDSELADYFKKILIELPDFEYVRLKKVFRRKASSVPELLTNIDTIFRNTVPTSLQQIELGIFEIQEGQLELLEQTKLLQEFLETQFDLILDNQVKIEEFLLQKLGSDFEKIKHIWKLYKEKKISAKEFVKESSKLLGMKSIKVITEILMIV